MLMKSLLTLEFGTFLLVSAQIAANAAKMVQKMRGSLAIRSSEGTSIPGLSYRRESVDKFFCHHN